MPGTPEQEFQKQVLQQLTPIAENLKAISCTSLINLLYDRTQVSDLIQQYRRLREEDEQAFAALTETYQADEDRRPKAIEAAMEQRRASMAKCGAFRSEHPLIVELIQLNTAAKRFGE